jgi:hypothetical protein
VQSALSEGQLELERLQQYRKLRRKRRATRHRSANAAILSVAPPNEEDISRRNAKGPTTMNEN